MLDLMTTPAPLGHRHPRVIEAVRNALERPTLDEGWSTPTREAAAADLLGIAFSDEDWVGAVRFALTGSEANDLALSLAQALTGRQPLVARERAYHGMVGLARDVTVQPQWHGGISSRTQATRAAPQAVPVRVLKAPFGHLSSGLSMTPEQAEDSLREADEVLADSAAVIIDYTQGGFYSTPAYQDALARKARRAGAIWIADEVVTGFGKCGRWFNFQRGEERPDIVTLGKPMGGGVCPVGGVVLSADLIERIGDGSWQNYSAMRSTEIAAAAAQAFVRVVAEEDLVARADALHATILAGMRQLAASHASVSRADGCGLHWWIELGAADWRAWEGRGGDPPLSSRVASRVLEAGALVATSGEANVLLITVPLVIEDEELDTMFTALDHGLSLADAEL